MFSKKMKPFKVIVMLIAVLLIIQMPAAYATSLSDLKEQQKDIKEKTSELKDSINEKESAIGSIENEQTKLLDQISTLSNKIDDTNNTIAEVSSDIAETEKEISKLNGEIEQLIAKIEERNVLLQERARAIQISGNISYLDVLLGANSFVDFIDRFSAVTTILDADKTIIREQKEDKNKLEDQKIIVENKKQQLEENEAELKALKKSLDGQKNEKRVLVTKLEAEQEKLTEEKQLLEEEYSDYVEISKENEKKIAAEQARLAELARKKAEEEARKRAEAEKNNQTAQGSTPVVSAGTWTKPANGRFTSPFGWRNLGFGREFHYGIDIANSVGTPIVAANSGFVSYAGTLSTYGNVIMITHYVNGQTWTTVYAHLSAIQVSVGQEVEKAQQIGLMGNTGRSFGSHLHFEIHDGPWVGGRPHAKNPLQYINL